MPKVKPFLRWVGGKQRLIKKLQQCIPPYLDETEYTYYEPFLGAGSMVLALQPPHAVVGDINTELVNTYQVLQSIEDISLLEQELQSYANEESYYYHVRDEMDLDSLTDMERAARFIYLNRTCYAGLYRENRSGKFNVSWGKNPKIKHENMQDISPVVKYLQSGDISIQNSDFQTTLQNAKEGDFVYMDPPYYPSTATSFTSYHKGSGFDYDALYDTFLDLHERGCYVLMSESDCPHNRERYADFILDEIKLGGTIRPELNKGRRELLICNYNLEE